MKKISSFQERFCEISDESGLNQTELGNRIHVSCQTISAWRLGTRTPKHPAILAVANYFHINPNWLKGYDVDKLANETERNIIYEGEAEFRKDDLFSTFKLYERICDSLIENDIIKIEKAENETRIRYHWTSEG